MRYGILSLILLANQWWFKNELNEIMCGESFEEAIRKNTDSDGIIHWENIELPRLEIDGEIPIKYVPPKD